MTAEPTTGADAQTVPWWTPPGQTDTTAFAALILLFLLIFAVFHFYARFDRFAEEHNEGTPLKTTIPTLLMIAFAYEIFPPLSHFSILLPLALIATALARDLMLWFEPRKEHILKGELEGALLDELQHEHIGEHDHSGRRVHEEPPEKPSAKPSEKSPAQSAAKRRPRAAKAEPSGGAEQEPQGTPATPADKEAGAKGGTGRD
ncbi:hypothetical protein AUC68_07315 [Methyloceanibacter methanicus]|uniref:Uncharacterized protein n=1 Tax=Methyloceanibacter methanicus TaxID=1774968 RepID=A0A1E3W0C2_9HYPH|nr:hypothetical protein [Methyloceanibacter methanicus]ODR98961.1 hypothetical protein AUC68_07315 [Methyloceanibacter methanicus]